MVEGTLTALGRAGESHVAGLCLVLLTLLLSSSGQGWVGWRVVGLLTHTGSIQCHSLQTRKAVVVFLASPAGKAPSHVEPCHGDGCRGVGGWGQGMGGWVGRARGRALKGRASGGFFLRFTQSYPRLWAAPRHTTAGLDPSKPGVEDVAHRTHIRHNKGHGERPPETRQRQQGQDHIGRSHFFSSPLPRSP